MTYNDEEQDAKEEEEDETEECNICECEVPAKDIAVSLRDEEDKEGNSLNDIDICNGCLKIIMGKANIPIQTETKVVEKVIEKPVEKLVEKIVYRTVDKNGNEVGQAKTNWTKFDC